MKVYVVEYCLGHWAPVLGLKPARTLAEARESMKSRAYEWQKESTRYRISTYVRVDKPTKKARKRRV